MNMEWVVFVDCIKAVIFDLDGVIVHTDVFHYKAWKALADKLGIPFSQQDNHRLRGISRMDSLDIVLEKSEREYSDEEKAGFAEEKNDRYRNYLMSMTPADIDTEILEGLKFLREKGYKLAIGSSSRNARLILEKVGILNLFDAISDGNNITHSKPNPEVFLKAAEFIGVQPQYCAIVEDARAGIEAGKQAGMFTIAVDDAAMSGEADFNATSFDDIIKAVVKI